MWRLTPPTRATFAVAVAAIAAGIVVQLGFVDLADIDQVEDPAFWLTAAGGIVMTIGVLFKRV